MKGNSLTMHNRNIANRILAAVFALFATLTVLKYIFRESFLLGLLAFAAEASLVGGIADWFAVTALFRKPFGFSWHTAIIPNSRRTIIEKVSDIVSRELLSVDALKVRLSNVRLTDAIVDKLSEAFDAATMEKGFRDFFGEKAEAVDMAELAGNVEGFIKSGLRQENVSAWIRGVLVKSFDEGRQKEWFSALLSRAVEIAGKSSTGDKIYDVLKRQETANEAHTGAGAFFVRTLLSVSRNSKHTNLRSISEVLRKELVDTLARIKSPDDPIFVRLEELSAHFIRRMDEDDVLLDVIQTWKNGILDRVDLSETLDRLLASVVKSGMRREEAAQWLASQLDGYWRQLKYDAVMKEWIDDLLKNMLEKMIRSEHHVIGEIVAETLESFTNERLVQFIEDKAGNDLQWIRINGSIVGAAAGALLYLFTHLLYGPFVVPLIHRLLGIG